MARPSPKTPWSHALTADRRRPTAVSDAANDGRRTAVYGRLRSACSGASLALLLVLAACGTSEEAEPAVRSHLSGRITVSPEVDSIPDYAGFEVLIARPDSQGLDTMGYAVTDTSGHFALDVEAPERGVYPLRISRRGVTLKTDPIAVAEGDTATLTAELPMPARRPLPIRSAENAAWMAYRSAQDFHRRALVTALRGEATGADVLGRQVQQTANLLWSLQQQFPGTIGADVGASEAVVMLEGWDDSLLVERAHALSPGNPGFVDAARAARRAQARLGGQDAALALLDSFATRATSERQRAALKAERVVAYLDSLDREAAREAATQLQQAHAGTDWADWADEALYEIDHLLPGLPAPDLQLTTLDGVDVALADLRGRYVVLEFYDPHDQLFRRQLDLRSALAEQLRDSLAFVSVSVEPDTSLNEAFLEGRDLAGYHVVAPEGVDAEAARRYNVHVLPTRYLIDPQGTLRGKYVGQRFGVLPRDLARIRADEAAPRPPA